MMNCFKCDKHCYAIWFSGFFGAVCFGHFMRLMLHVDLIVGTFFVPRMVSVIACPVAGILAILFCWFGCQQRQCSDGNSSSGTADKNV